jgi:hypothetical protein
MLGNKRMRELHWEPGKLAGQLDDGEHGRRAPAPAAAAMAAGGSGWRAEGGARGLYTWLGTSVGDEG